MHTENTTISKLPSKYASWANNAAMCIMIKRWGGGSISTVDNPLLHSKHNTLRLYSSNQLDF